MMYDRQKQARENPNVSDHCRTEEDLSAFRADFHNRAAEHYFVRKKNTKHLLRKPFTSPREMAESLYRFSVLVAGMDVNATDLIMDFGAGTCWVSLLLSRAGIHSVAVDVSATALEIGRKIFESIPPDQRGVPPRFVVYDGHRLPFEDGYFDAILCLDAFHHVPNKQVVLSEMFRVLSPGGRVAFSEPGEGHSRTSESQREARIYSVLESDVLLEEVETWARRAGFDRLTVWPLPHPGGRVEMAWNEAQRFLTGDDDAFPIGEFRHSARTAPFFFLQKGRREPDSRHPKTLRAEIRLHRTESVKVRAGELWELPCTVMNVGDTRWLAGPLEKGGDVCLGAHLLDAAERVEELDYGRARLPRDIPPGHNETLLLRLRAPERPGSYSVELDMVAERVTWFEDQGSSTSRIALKVS